MVDDSRFRRLVAALLLCAVFDANNGDVMAAEWIRSNDARRWALLLGIDCWPPTSEQMARANKRELRRWRIVME